MRPQDSRVWRKARRRALKGVPTGRRATHAVETTYGQQQRARDRQEQFSAFCAARREMTGATS